MTWWQKSNGNAAAVSQRRTQQGGRGCLIVFFALFALIGAVIGYLIAIQPMMQIAAAQDWVEVPCKILSSEVQTHDGDSTTYSVSIRYSYRYQAQDYESDRYQFFTGSSSGYEGKRQVVEQYPAGSEAVCYVNPADPSEAVIDRGLTAEIWFGLIPLLFVMIGVGGIVATIVWPEGSSSKSAIPWTPSSRAAAAIPIERQLERPHSPAGPVTVHATQSPRMRLLGTVFIALLWNGILAVPLSAVTGMLGDGEIEWFLVLFMVPFVLVGLLLIGLCGYYLLALFNPTPVMTLSSASVALGDSLEIRWQLEGRTSSIRRLRVKLIGEEVATYRRGTNTYTDRHTFFEQVLAEETNPVDIPAGRARVELPIDTMHSFEAPNNKVAWKINLHGEISVWPDVNGDYDLVVLPRPLASFSTASASDLSQ